ncbi:MAG: hypothetical protein ABI647_26350 [Gemmatimonadota bacterium]
MGAIEQVAHWLAPWQSIYNGSTVLSGSVTAAHILAMLLGGGLAIAADRSTLRLTGSNTAAHGHQLTELEAVHRPVLIALVVVFVTGLLLTAADFKTFMKAPIFWVKMGLVVLLMVNGAVLTRTENTLRRVMPEEADGLLWARLRINSWISMALWAVILVVSVFLTDSA